MSGILSAIAAAVWAQSPDSLTSPALPDTVLTYPVPTPEPPRHDLVSVIADYIASANDPRPNKKFDFSVIGGPYYSSDTKFGIGLVAAGIMRRRESDSLPSGQVDLYGDISVAGYYKVGIRGQHMLSARGNRQLTYDVSFESAPDRFWGIGYRMASNSDNMTRYKRWHANADASYLFGLSPTLWTGPRLLLDFLDARDVTRPELWDGQPLRTYTMALGAALVYDTRDNPFNAYRGVYLRLDQMFAPRFIRNKMAFSFTEITLAHYQRLWKGAVLASRLHTRITYGNTPWGLMSKFGGSYSMRGYWEGRYNDKCSAELTVELRQHVWRRNGLVVWGGVGDVFPRLDRMFHNKVLWNFGVGYRWEFKNRVNVRIDYGFGRGESGLIFNINEAF